VEGLDPRDVADLRNDTSTLYEMFLREAVKANMITDISVDEAIRDLRGVKPDGSGNTTSPYQCRPGYRLSYTFTLGLISSGDKCSETIYKGEERACKQDGFCYSQDDKCTENKLPTPIPMPGLNIIQKQNCVFCERVLFSAYKGNQNFLLSDKENTEIAVAGASNGSKNINDIMANYYLTRPSTLKIDNTGHADKIVFHMNPKICTVVKGSCDNKNEIQKNLEDLKKFTGSIVDPFTISLDTLDVDYTESDKNPFAANLPLESDYNELARGQGAGLIEQFKDKKGLYICPKGMIESVKKDDGELRSDYKNRLSIICIPYIVNPSRRFCPTTNPDGDYKYEKGFNNLLVDDTIGNRSITQTAAFQRPGCDIGYTLQYDSTSKYLRCSSIFGGSNAPKAEYNCRPGYGLQPYEITQTVKENDITYRLCTNNTKVVLSNTSPVPAANTCPGSNYNVEPKNYSGDVRIFTLKCLEEKYTAVGKEYLNNLTCSDVITAAEFGGAGYAGTQWCNNGEIAGDVINLTPTRDSNLNTSTKSNDLTVAQCKHDNRNSPDEFGRINNIMRAPNIMLIDDCRACM